MTLKRYCQLQLVRLELGKQMNLSVCWFRTPNSPPHHQPRRRGVDGVLRLYFSIIVWKKPEDIVSFVLSICDGGVWGDGGGREDTRKSSPANHES